MGDLPTLPSYLFEPSLAGALSLVLTVLLPLGAALVMRRTMPAGMKATILLFMSAVKSFVEAWIAHVNAHTPFSPWPVAYAIVINFGLAVVAYFGIWQNTVVQRKAIDGGIVNDGLNDGL